MYKKIVFVFACPLFAACSTLDQSFKLGATTGALAGAVATYTAESSAGRNAKLSNVGIGASIGMGIGLLSSYLIHQSVAEDRDESRKADFYFGDLPPSPFIHPNSNSKGR